MILGFRAVPLFRYPQYRRGEHCGVRPSSVSFADTFPEGEGKARRTIPQLETYERMKIQ